MPGSEPTPPRQLLAQSDRERLIILDRDVREVKNQMSEGTQIMTTMQAKQNDHAILLERINNKSTLATWVLGVICVAVVGSIVAFLGKSHEAQQIPPIKIELIQSEK